MLKALDPNSIYYITGNKPIKDQLPNKYHLLIEAGFDELMTEKEITSLAAQIVRCYAANRRVLQPFTFTISSFGGKLEEKFKQSHPDYQKFDIELVTEPYLSKYTKEELVYLSADAEETFEEMDKDKIYIIGGLVDRNRHKVIPLFVLFVRILRN